MSAAGTARPAHAAGWYRETALPQPAYPPLEEEAAAEVCVVGGGLAGLTTALELARRGRSVRLLEARRIAWGASGRNAGFVLPGFALDMERIAARVGLPAAQALYRLSAEGAGYVRAHLAARNPAIEMGRGFLLAMRSADADGARRLAEGLARDYGRETEVWDHERTRAVLSSRRYHAALHDPAGFHIHPLNYAASLAAAAAEAGALLHEASPALSLERRGGVLRVATPAGAVAAESVVLCTSGYGRGLAPALDRAVVPVATYIAVTPPLGEMLDLAVQSEAAIADTRRAGDYYRRVGGDRLLWGGRITTRQSEPRRLGALLGADMAAVYPQLDGVAMEQAWSGLMGYCLHKMPLIGQIAPGLWTATAFGGHGLNTTAMAGCLLAAALAEGDDSWRRFAAFAPRWAGGPFARPGLQLAYWGMQLRDRLDERPGKRDKTAA